MKKGIICVLVCMLMITTATTVVGQTKFFISENEMSKNIEKVMNPLANDEWMKTYGNWREDAGFSVQQTLDGGYIIVGVTASYGAGKNDVWLIKTDSTGNKIWDKTFGGADRDFGNSVQQTSDGGYIITGSTRSYGAGLDDVWLIKTDPEGYKVWDKTFGYGMYDSGSQVRQTSDDGYIIVGDVNNDGGGYSDIWVVKTDANGNMVWNKTFDGEGKPLSHDYGTSIGLTSDGGYILTGVTYTTQETYGYNIWLIKINANGTTIWDKKFGGTDCEFASSVSQTNDGGYIMVGVDSYSNSNEKIWLIKTDGNGDFLWEQKYGGIGTARGESVQLTSDGGYIIAGFTYTKLVRFKALLIKTDSNGVREWSRIFFGGVGNCIAFSVQQTSDGGYIIAGDRNVFLNTNMWLIKINGN